ncbi:hypothetical protein BD626DRAFT_511498, partial [Schizophyllum amplum]
RRVSQKACREPTEETHRREWRRCAPPPCAASGRAVVSVVPHPGAASSAAPSSRPLSKTSVKIYHATAAVTRAIDARLSQVLRKEQHTGFLPRSGDKERRVAGDVLGTRCRGIQRHLRHTAYTASDMWRPIERRQREVATARTVEHSLGMALSVVVDGGEEGRRTIRTAGASGRKGA